ncbi:MAG: hypothetical protein LBP80_06845 [Treponema sp.]|jgi:hypothetical protein|nr:hypothetical protein [Treponema sp.]
MDAKAMLKERTELFDNAINFRKNKRVPLVSNFFTWKILDAGYKLSEALYDYGIMEKVNDEFHRRYQFDAYFDLGTRNPMRVMDALGAGFHKIDPTDEAIVVDDHHIMERDDYRELASNPMGFYWAKAFKRYCKPGITMGEMENAVKEFIAFGQYAGKITNKYINEYGAMLLATNYIFIPFEQLFNALRGIRELALDIRKCKAQMKETMDTMFVNECEPVLKRAVDADYAGFVAPLTIAFLGHSLLSADQFGELYWPYFKKVLDVAIRHKKPIFCFCESTMLRFAEFFQDVPKGVLLIHLEQDDIFEIRKKLPNIALAGGMPTDLLGHGTKEQCVDYAKKLIDTLGDGFVLSQDKMMSYRNDAKRENLLAVNEFARTYQY